MIKMFYGDEMVVIVITDYGYSGNKGSDGDGGVGGVIIVVW
jgi:hypothetical protein